MLRSAAYRSSFIQAPPQHPPPPQLLTLCAPTTALAPTYSAPISQVDATGRPLLALPPAVSRLRPVSLSSDPSAAFTAAYLEWLAAEDLQRISADGSADASGLPGGQSAQARRNADVLLRLARESCTAVGMSRRGLAGGAAANDDDATQQRISAFEEGYLGGSGGDGGDARARRRREEAEEAEFARSFLRPVDELIRRCGHGQSADGTSADPNGLAADIRLGGRGAVRAMGAEQALKALMQPRAVVGSRRDLEAGLVRTGNAAAGNYNTGRRCDYLAAQCSLSFAALRSGLPCVRVLF